jgi:hypothetical protein
MVLTTATGKRMSGNSSTGSRVQANSPSTSKDSIRTVAK